MRILRGVGSQVLPCQCLVGLYETYDGRSIAIIDEHHPDCPDKTHSLHRVMSASFTLGLAKPKGKVQPLD